MPSPLHAHAGGAGYETKHGMAGSRSVECHRYTVDLQLYMVHVHVAVRGSLTPLDAQLVAAQIITPKQYYYDEI